MKVFFSVGEPSGDLHGANLSRALREQAGEPIEAVGYGATTPIAQGSDAEDPADRRVEFHVFRLRSDLQ